MGDSTELNVTAQTRDAFEFEILRRALEQSDADLLLSLYADDAEMRVVDRNRPPSSPFELRGKSAIEAFWRDICGREMTHSIEREVIGSDRVSFVEACVYPDGCRVLSAMVLDLREGRIVRHLTVQAWDEVSCVSG
jgi:ketosteroid isomerase-like protein